MGNGIGDENCLHSIWWTHATEQTQVSTVDRSGNNQTFDLCVFGASRGVELSGAFGRLVVHSNFPHGLSTRRSTG